MTRHPPPTNLLYAARLTILLDGETNLPLTAALINMLVEEREEGPAHCELTFGNWGSTGGEAGYLYFDRRTLDFGRPIRIEAGDGEARAPIFEGRITALEGRFPRQRPPEISLLAEDRLQDLRMTRRTRIFEEMCDAEIVERIAAEHGLTHKVDLPGPTHPLVAQLNQSDLAFLHERVRTVGGVLWVEGNTLYAMPFAEREGVLVELTYGQRLLEFVALADLAMQRTAVNVHGWDEQAKSALKAKGRLTALSSRLQGVVGSAEVLETSFGPREEHLVHHAATRQAIAEALADAAAMRMARRFVRGRGICEGDGRIRVGTRLKLNEIGPMFEGIYDVVEVKHTFDSIEGFRTKFVVERPGIGV